MKSVHKLFRICGCLFLVFLAVFSLTANAGMIAFESTKVIAGNADSLGDDIFINEGGDYKVTLTDFKMSGAFEGIGVGIDNNLGVRQGEIFGQGSFTFKAISPGLYHLDLSFDSAIGIGLIGISLERVDLGDIGTPTPVPLPAPLFLLLSAVLPLFAVINGKRRKIVKKFM